MKVVGPLGRKFDFVSPSGFEIQNDFDYRTSTIKFYSERALKCYPNEKNLIHGEVTATISKFSPQIFETCFKYQNWKIIQYEKDFCLSCLICSMHFHIYRVSQKIC